MNWGGRAPISLPKPRNQLARATEGPMPLHYSFAEGQNPQPNSSWGRSGVLKDLHSRQCPVAGTSRKGEAALPSTASRRTQTPHPARSGTCRRGAAVAHPLISSKIPPGCGPGASPVTLQTRADRLGLGARHASPRQIMWPRLAPPTLASTLTWRESSTNRALAGPRGRGSRRNRGPWLQKEDGTVKEKDRQLPSLPALWRLVTSLLGN